MQIEAGTQIGTVECPGCGAEVPLKVNRAGGVYYFCAAVLERDENGKAKEKCLTRFNFGRTASRRMINEFLKQEKIEDVKQPENREEEGYTPASEAGDGEPVAGGGDGSGEPAAAPQGAGGGFAAGIKHFLTGDA